MTKEEVTIIRRYYAETVKQLDEAEQSYNADKKSVKKRKVYQYIFAQASAVSDICDELEIELYDENLNLIEEA